MTLKPLQVKGHQLQSAGTDAIVPHSSGIPWLYRNANEQMLQWRAKIKSVADYYLNQSERASKELGVVDLLPSTKIRLEILNKSYQKNAEIFFSYFKKIDGKDTASLNEIEKVYFEKVPRQQTVKAYHETIFRDWVWGKNEIEKQAQIIEPFINGGGNMLVLGAGACGLPLKLHQDYKFKNTLAVDINPVFLMTVQELLSNQTVTLIENPLIPKNMSDVSLEHKIQFSQKIKGFHLLLADAQSLNTKKEVFDTVLTPWFIDIVPRNFRELARHINQSLKKGGQWLNIGLLDFHRYQLSEIYTKDEVADALMEAGFRIEEIKHVSTPYLQSPHNMMGRFDQLLTFSAVKEKSAKETPRYDYLPDWLRDWNTPIPLHKDIQNFMIKSTIFSQTVSFVDGKRSLSDIAQILSKQSGMPEHLANEAVYNFFVNVYEQVIFREF